MLSRSCVRGCDTSLLSSFSVLPNELLIEILEFHVSSPREFLLLSHVNRTWRNLLWNSYPLRCVRHRSLSTLHSQNLTSSLSCHPLFGSVDFEEILPRETIHVWEKHGPVPHTHLRHLVRGVKESLLHREALSVDDSTPRSTFIRVKKSLREFRYWYWRLAEVVHLDEVGILTDSGLLLFILTFAVYIGLFFFTATIPFYVLLLVFIPSLLAPFCFEKCVWEVFSHSFVSSLEDLQASLPLLTDEEEKEAEEEVGVQIWNHSFRTTLEHSFQVQCVVIGVFCAGLALFRCFFTHDWLRYSLLILFLCASGAGQWIGLLRNLSRLSCCGFGFPEKWCFYLALLHSFSWLILVVVCDVKHFQASRKPIMLGLVGFISLVHFMSFVLRPTLKNETIPQSTRFPYDFVLFFFFSLLQVWGPILCMTAIFGWSLKLFGGVTVLVAVGCMMLVLTHSPRADGVVFLHYISARKDLWWFWLRELVSGLFVCSLCGRKKLRKE